VGEDTKHRPESLPITHKTRGGWGGSALRLYYQAPCIPVSCYPSDMAGNAQRKPKPKGPCLTCPECHADVPLPDPPNGLNSKQKAFVEAATADPTASGAELVRRSGYKDTNPSRAHGRLVANSSVASALTRRRDELLDKASRIDKAAIQPLLNAIANDETGQVSLAALEWARKARENAPAGDGVEHRVHALDLERARQRRRRSFARILRWAVRHSPQRVADLAQAIWPVDDGVIDAEVVSDDW